LEDLRKKPAIQVVQLPRKPRKLIMSSAVALKDYSGAAASLFNNMKTPASILAGAMVGLGFLAPLPDPPSKLAFVSSAKGKKGGVKQEMASGIQKRVDRMLRKSFFLVTIFSFGR
jgi:hypothetical protein